MRPLAVDLFCGAGGISVGLHRAGFDVVGVDIQEQPSYPFEFLHMDALEFAEAKHLTGWTYRGREIAYVHASPPCQNASWSARRWVHEGRAYPDLIPPVREALRGSNRPYTLENVVGAELFSPIWIEGPDVGLGYRLKLIPGELFPRWIPAVIRRRLFESNVPLVPPFRSDWRRRGWSARGGQIVTAAGHGGNGPASIEIIRLAMGCEWMTKRPAEYGDRENPGNREDVNEAIPPAYAEFIGRQVMEFLKVDAVRASGERS